MNGGRWYVHEASTEQFFIAEEYLERFLANPDNAGCTEIDPPPAELEVQRSSIYARYVVLAMQFHTRLEALAKPLSPSQLRSAIDLPRWCVDAEELAAWHDQQLSGILSDTVTYLQNAARASAAAEERSLDRLETYQ